MSCLSRRRVVGTALLVLAIVACSDRKNEAVDSAVVTAAPVDTPRTPRPGERDCPVDGMWRECGLLERLVRSGMAPKVVGDTMHTTLFSVPGIRLTIGRGGTLTVFYFADSTAARQAAARIDTMHVRMPGDTIGPWAGTPHFIRSANLIAVLESDNARQVERIQLAITAGAP